MGIGCRVQVLDAVDGREVQKLDAPGKFWFEVTTEDAKGLDLSNGFGWHVELLANEITFQIFENDIKNWYRVGKCAFGTAEQTELKLCASESDSEFGRHRVLPNFDQSIEIKNFPNE